MLIITLTPSEHDFRKAESEMMKKLVPKAYADRRLLTFNQRDLNGRGLSWPHAKPSPKQMADAGFYLVGPGDRVQCFWCGVDLVDWEETDDPLEEHAKFSEKCPVFGKDVIHV